ncbi:MAG: response regulator, partial [Actinobacteria bacterium]|nr:response regulator [Actinomycetota bacterium]
MTASTLAEDRARCLAAGMNDHLSKPFEPSDLWEILRRWIPAREESGSADSFTGAGVSD